MKSKGAIRRAASAVHPSPSILGPVDAILDELATRIGARLSPRAAASPLMSVDEALAFLGMDTRHRGQLLRLTRGKSWRIAKTRTLIVFERAGFTAWASASRRGRLRRAPEPPDVTAHRKKSTAKPGGVD